MQIFRLKTCFPVLRKITLKLTMYTKTYHDSIDERVKYNIALHNMLLISWSFYHSHSFWSNPSASCNL